MAEDDNINKMEPEVRTGDEGGQVPSLLEELLAGGAGNGALSGPGHSGRVTSTGGTDITFFEATTAAPGEAALEAAVAGGHVSPEVAAAWFHDHGHPELTGTPAFSVEHGMWLFPGADGGSGGQVVDGTAVAPTSSEATGSGPVAGRGSGSSPADGNGGSSGIVTGGGDTSGGGDDSSVNSSGGHPTPSTSRQPPTQGPSSRGRTPGPGESGPPRTGEPAGTTPPNRGVPGGRRVPPTSEPIIITSVWDPPTAHGPIPRPAGPDPTLEPGDDGRVYHAESTFAREQVAAGIREAMDKNNPALVRYILQQLLPAAMIGELVEQYFVNPLLAAPANIIEAAELVEKAARETTAGEYHKAAAHARDADAKLKEAALAIIMVVPLGGPTAAAGTQLAPGVEYLGPRVVTSAERWAIEQVWVTKTNLEHWFRVDGYKVFVDGFINKTGVEYVTTISDMVLVEAKMASRVRTALEVAGTFAHSEQAKLIDQAARYLLLNERLGTGGVRYVVTETPNLAAATVGEQTPATTGLIELFTRHYPEQISNGTLKVVFTPPPP